MTLRSHTGLASRFLATPRDIVVYLPPGYGKEERKYPVLYLNDGQNLFTGETSFIRGRYWRAGEAADALTAAGAVEPLILVGIYNAGDARVNEYTPVKDRKGRGGQARLYGKMLVEELKPFIDAEYRTERGPDNTGIGGSSLGALAALYLGQRYPRVFGKIAAMSPSVWWSRRAILRRVLALKGKLPLKIWLDTGGLEGPRAAEDARDLRDAFIAKGWRLDQDLAWMEDPAGTHDEDAWAKRIQPMLRFLYPPKS